MCCLLWSRFLGNFGICIDCWFLGDNNFLYRFGIHCCFYLNIFCNLGNRVRRLCYFRENTVRDNGKYSQNWFLLNINCLCSLYMIIFPVLYRFYSLRNRLRMKYCLLYNIVLDRFLNIKNFHANNNLICNQNRHFIRNLNRIYSL